MAINKRLINPGFEAPTPPVPTSFNTVTYTGAQGTGNRSITGVGFKPDFVWIKERTSTSSHSLADIVRGPGLILQSDLTNAEVNVVANLVSFDSDGFTIGNSNGVNETGQDYVAWCWKAGGAAVTNTDGTITSQVSANTEAGFSVLTYTGNSVNGATIGHGLTQTPSVFIIKGRSGTDPITNWSMYHSSLGANASILLNRDLASVASKWNNTAPTSSVFYVDNSGDVNLSGTNFVAYCFAEVAGFSKFGSYTGTGSAGNFQDCGFEPAFVMVKRYDGTGNWFLLDNKRNPTDPRNNPLYPNLSNAEGSLGTGLNFLSTGFSFSGGSINTSGENWIFMAFANQF